MEKKINKKKIELNDAQTERARKKVIYDSSIVILEGQRNTVRELEKRSELLLNEFVSSDNKVREIQLELDALAQQIDGKDEEQ